MSFEKHYKTHKGDSDPASARDVSYYLLHRNCEAGLVLAYNERDAKIGIHLD